MPSRPHGRRIPAAASLALLVLMAAGPGAPHAAEPGERPIIYKWVDEHGIAHYTTDRDRIPRAIRSRVQRLNRPSAVPETTPGEPPEPQSAATPSGSEPTTGGPAPDLSPPPPVGPPPEPPAISKGEPSQGEQWAISNVPERVEPHLSPREDGLDPETAKELAKIDEQITSLEGEIAQGEDRLLALLAGGAPTPDGVQSYDDELREIADTLPRLQSDLDTLRQRRESLQPASGS